MDTEQPAYMKLTGEQRAARITALLGANMKLTPEESTAFDLPFTNARNGRIAELKADWTKIFSEPAKKKSASYEAHYAAANQIDTLFEQGVKMWEEPPRNGSHDIRAYAKYGCPFVLGDDTYLAQRMLAGRETKRYAIAIDYG